MQQRQELRDIGIAWICAESLQFEVHCARHVISVRDRLARFLVQAPRARRRDGGCWNACSFAWPCRKHRIDDCLILRRIARPVRDR